MANAPDSNEVHAEAVTDVKRLMRLARTGALASLEPTGGAPLTTLVGVASDFDGAPLFLMSTLSRHTRNLANDPRASLLLTGAHERGDPLNYPRVTLSGRVERCGGAPRQGPVFTAQSQGWAVRRVRRFLALQASDRRRPFQRRLRQGRAAHRGGSPRLGRGRSRIGRGRRAAHRRGERAGPSQTRAPLGAQCFAPDLAGDRSRRRGPRPCRRRPRGRAQFAAPAHDPEAWRAHLRQLLAAG